MDIREFFRLVRIEHGLMFAAAVFIGEVIAGKIPEIPILVLSLLIPIFSEMGAFALNDYLDIEADRLNKRKRPLVTGTIRPKFALWFSVSSLVLSTVLAYFINIPVFLLAFSLNLLAVSYNIRLKDLPLVGNIYIAFTMGIPFIFGNMVVSEMLYTPSIILFVLGFTAGLAREIVKSIEDMHGDKAARGSRTLPILIGDKYSAGIAIALYVLFIPITYLPFLYGLQGTFVTYTLVTVGNILIMKGIYSVLKKDYRLARNLSLIAFGFGIAGYLLSTSVFSLGL